MLLIERDYGKLGIEIIGRPEMTRRNVISEVKGEPQSVVRVLELGTPNGLQVPCSDITADIAEEIYAQLGGERPSWHLLNFLQKYDAAPLSLEAAE